jgi:hypothetical protein
MLFLQVALNPAPSSRFISEFRIAGPRWLYSYGGMKSDPTHDAAAGNLKPTAGPGRLRTARRWLYTLGTVIGAYLVGAYVIMPFAWRTDTRRHPDLSDGPRLTHAADGLPGDPVNVALVAAESELIHGMLKAGWFPADPITFDSSVRIAVDSVFRRPDDDAPVSNLYLFNRKQDLAFEQPVGDSPRRRHHVRFWHWDRLADNLPVWFGAATFDERVGLSYTTGQVTPHIGPDIDAERDRIVAELKKAGLVQRVYWVDHFHQQLQGKNGGGDPWHTDGRLEVAILVMHTNAPPVATNSSGSR